MTSARFCGLIISIINQQLPVTIIITSFTGTLIVTLITITEWS